MIQAEQKRTGGVQMRVKKKCIVLIAAIMMFGSVLSAQADDTYYIVEQISDECRSPLCYDYKNLENYHRFLARAMTGEYVIINSPTGDCCR